MSIIREPCWLATACYREKRERELQSIFNCVAESIQGPRDEISIVSLRETEVMKTRLRRRKWVVVGDR